MQNVGRCPKCNKVLIAEQYGDHVCTRSPRKTPLKGAKTIAIDHYFETQTDNGDTVLIARGLDGFFYRLVRCFHTPLHVSSDDSYHDDSSDKDLTEPLIEPAATWFRRLSSKNVTPSR